MGIDSKIEWTHHTANLWWGCTEVHEGCDNCYAAALDNRYNHENTHWGNDKPRKAVKGVWGDFMRAQDVAKAAGERHRVFVGSMMDIFEKSFNLESPLMLPSSISENGRVIDLTRSEITNGAALEPFRCTSELRQFFLRVIVPLCPNLIFLLLTKRPGNINPYIPKSWKETPPNNVMFGCSVVNQATADRLIPQLLAVNGKMFLSIEPQLDIVNLNYIRTSYNENRSSHVIDCLNGLRGALIPNSDNWAKIDWVICGGESGPNKRPFDANWARSLKTQCKAAGVPFFMKQIDKIQPIPEDLEVRQYPSYHLEKSFKPTQP